MSVCPLCGFDSTGGPTYPEGVFCNDTAGCRRRALALIQRRSHELASAEELLLGYRKAALAQVREQTGL